MTAYNVVRFRVKPGMEDNFVASQRKSFDTQSLPGMIEISLIKTGDSAYCLVGKWKDFASIVAARPTLIGYLDEVRSLLEDLGGELGVTDPVSGEAVLERQFG